MSARIDHLVIAAATLDEGVRWCEGDAGRHARARRPASADGHAQPAAAAAATARAYLRDHCNRSRTAPTPAAGTHRWFDLDDADLRTRLQHEGPQLIHFVASVPDAAEALRALAGLRIDRGALVDASRETPPGLLELAHQRARRRPAAFLRRAAHADRMGAGASGGPAASLALGVDRFAPAASARARPVGSAGGDRLRQPGVDGRGRSAGIAGDAEDAARRGVARLARGLSRAS